VASKVKGRNLTTGEAVAQPLGRLPPTGGAAGNGFNRIAHQSVNRILRHTKGDGPPSPPSSHETFRQIFVQTFASARDLPATSRVSPTAKIVARLIGVEVRFSRTFAVPRFLPIA